MADLLTPQLNAESPVPDWLQARRLAGRAAWESSELPTRKTEAWKYTSLFALQQPFMAARESAESAEELGLELPQLAGSRLVFVNGFWREDLSDIWPDAAIELVRFSEADQTQAALIAQHLGSAVPGNKHPFSALNDAVLADGVFLRILKGSKAACPVQLFWHNSQQVDAAINSQRLLVLAEQHSEATVVEHFSGQGHSFTNGLSELILAAGATLNHSRLHLESAEALHVGGLHAALERDATLNSFHVAFGGKLKRIDIVINHQGHGAHCQLDGMYLLRGQEHVDYHTCIEHAVPHCTSDETFRGIVGDKASAVFNGRIHIHPDAQKTRAELSNKNLLTSATAEVNTKPELEIYADDVQCAHGATVAQLDESMLHYLRTRGIPAHEALVLLSYGFINALVEKQRLESLRDYLKPLLADYFGAALAVDSDDAGG